MKNFLMLTIFVLLIWSCKEAGNYANSDFEDVSWESEKLSTYQLVRPIDCEDASDAYGLPTRAGQWYLITRMKGCYLLPVYTDGGTGPDFVENVTRWNKIAIIDTMYSRFLGDPRTFHGLIMPMTLEVVCFKKGWSVQPLIMPNGQVTVVVKKNK